MEPNGIFDIGDEIQITRDYTNSHKEKTQCLYEMIHKKISEGKDAKAAKINKDREHLPEIPSDIFVRNRQKQNKTGNKYKKETVNTINTERKTAEINKQHANTSEGIHLSNIKRPNVPRNFPNVSDSGPSCSHSS
jgi:hypothetical protein